MDKKEKKSVISKFIDLANGRFKDAEVDTLYDLVTNRDKYDGRSHTYKSWHDSFSSDGKFSRFEETTHTIRNKGDRITIERKYQYQDDDGASGEDTSEYTTGRDILNNLWKALKK